MQAGKLELSNPRWKKSYNRKLFDSLAARYDLINNLLSFGREQRWKKYLIDKLPNMQPEVCVDLGCGTGDLCRLLRKKFPKALVHGLDLSQRMLSLAPDCKDTLSIDYTVQDMAALAFADNSVDLVTAGYALRNAPQLEGSLGEIGRILRKGGVLALIDFSKPENKFLQFIELWLLKIWGGFWGIVFYASPEKFLYLAESLRLYPDRNQLKELLQKKGFSIVHSKLFFLWSG